MRKKRESSAVLAILSLFLLVAHLHLVGFLDNGKDEVDENEILPIYKSQKVLGPDDHLKPVDVENEWEEQRLALDIDQVHRQGLLHVGHWIFVVNQSKLILFLRRSPSMVTCPGAWSPVGEHSKPSDANAEYSARRGIEEELGKDLWREHVSSIRELSPLPIFYYRSYGPSNGNRIDRQAVYLWLVQLDDDEVDLLCDTEAVAVKWLSLAEIDRWIKEDREDGVERFCHRTILDLLEVSVEELRKVL